MGFFDKLKGAETIKGDKQPKTSIKKGEGKKAMPKEDGEEVTSEPEPQKLAPIKKEKEKKIQEEGQLAIDLYETDAEFIVRSTIAGVKPEDLDITVENDMVTIKGSRAEQTEESSGKYYYQECYWGSFSRQIILPEEVDSDKTEASMKNGVLILRIPKARKIQKKKISITSE